MYLVTFDDNTTFEGGSPSASKWGDIPDKPIVSISYALTPFLKFVFSGYDAYCHCVERVKVVNKGSERITKVIIMGRTGDRVDQRMMDDKGGVYQLTVCNGCEYSPHSKITNGKFAGWDKGKPLSGWKKGFPGVPKIEKILKTKVTDGK